MQKYNTEKSRLLYEESQNYLLNGVASYFHKADYEDYPICFTHGKGSKLYDVDGNEYLDFVAGLGPMLLGYAPLAVNLAIRKQILAGTHFSATTPQLVALSKKLCQIIPCAERVAFAGSGTEANMFALRLARAYTGRNKIIKFEGTYHGWSDELKISVDAPCEAVLGERSNPAHYTTTKGQRIAASADIIVLPFNDVEQLEEAFTQHKGQVAGVIAEPYICDAGPIPPAEGFWQAAQELIHAEGALLIFDEVITGFRMALGGAQEYLGITPDIATYAKAATASLPLAFICGKREIMECGVPASGTFNGNPLGAAAALAAIAEYENEDFYPKLQAISKRFADGLTAIGKQNAIPLPTAAIGGMVCLGINMQGIPRDFRDWRNCFDAALYDRLCLGCRDYGLRLTDGRGRLCVSAKHTEADIDKALQIFEYVLKPLLK